MMSLGVSSGSSSVTLPDKPLSISPFSDFELVSFVPCVWGNLCDSDLVEVIDKCYDEALHWVHNIFKFPSGKCGNLFVNEISRLIRAYAESSPLESIALNTLILILMILLQKHHHRLKVKSTLNS